MKNDVSVGTAPAWGGYFGGILEYLGLIGLATFVAASLSPGWSDALGGPLGALNLVGLTTRVIAGLDKGWSSWKSALGLEDPRVTILAQIAIDKKKNQVVASFNGGGSGVGTWTLQTKALGGIFSGGVWRSIAQYASGTLDALHGSLFLAGEAGPEIVGHVGGRTEVLNKSQLAAAMYSAVHSAMAGVTLDADFRGYGTGYADDGEYETMYQVMYEAFTAALARGEAMDREKVDLLRQINEKDFTAEVSTADFNNAQRRMNRRAGTTIVPVGT